MSLITITFDETGIPMFDKLPPGVFVSSFASPPDGQTHEVISINARDMYTIQIVSPGGGLADVAGDAPGEVAEVRSGADHPRSRSQPRCRPRRPMETRAAPSTACLTPSAPWSIRRACWSPSRSARWGRSPSIEDDVPIGVHFEPEDHWFSVWTAGGYTFAFSLPSQNRVYIQDVIFNDPPDRSTSRSAPTT